MRLLISDTALHLEPPVSHLEGYLIRPICHYHKLAPGPHGFEIQPQSPLQLQTCPENKLDAISFWLFHGFKGGSSQCVLASWQTTWASLRTAYFFTNSRHILLADCIQVKLSRVFAS